MKMLLDLAVGDALGVGYEYNAEDIQKNYHKLLETYIQHPRHKKMLPGMYSDDTQMSLAIAELIIEDKEWTPLNIASKFVECFKRDERDGYARGFQAFLESINDGQEFLDKIKPESEKSGAAMRATPIGVRELSKVKDYIEKTKIQAELTHKTKKGVDAAIASTLLSVFCWNESPERQPDVNRHLPAFLESYVPGYEWTTPWRGKVGPLGIMSVKAAVTAIIETNNFQNLLKRCISFTGDVDTVAAIALGAASGWYEDLPENLVLQLENGKYGRDYLIEIDKKLV
jgi:ADP-ribosylglycohydrolase